MLSRTVSPSLAMALVGAGALAWTALPAPAPVPAPGPVFSHPLQFSSEYMPFVAGGVKYFEGSNDGAPVEVIDTYFSKTRTFKLNGKHVKCHQLEEKVYEDGEIHEISQNWFAQADDGTVYYFGETVDNYVDGRIENHDGSWLVGGPTKPSDPPETAVASVPAVFMPAEPEPGDSWKPEDLFPFVDETATVIQEDLELELPAGDFEDVILVRETSQLPGTTAGEKWYAPDVGVVRAKGVGEVLYLVDAEGFRLDDR